MSTKDGLVFTKDMADTAARYMIRVYCRFNVIDPSRPDLLNGYPYAVRLKTIIADLPKLK
ncbi:MAG: hypothetical protein HYZ71_11990 [Deltaproteobacteria bacterium]|nr:hypothetical protein [Deltaproteobacteria bacterium]